MTQPSEGVRAAWLPLTGRQEERGVIRGLLESAAASRGGTAILSGGSGVGKTRLLHAAVQEASRGGWTTLVGRAYPVESGIPYAPFADAFVPLLRSLDPAALATLTRGSEAELGYLFPMLRTAGAADASGGDLVELKTRLLWNFAQFLGRLSARQPLLLVFDDLQWADVSSLELLHFLARQIGENRIALICAYNDAVGGDLERLHRIEQSLTAIGAARRLNVGPLSHADTLGLVVETLGLSHAGGREVAALLFGWTRGNPFFLEEMLKMLVESGQVRAGEGGYSVLELGSLDLPRSIRDAVMMRVGTLRRGTRELADLLAVVGTSIAHDVIAALSSADSATLVDALEELRAARLVEERLEGGRIVYDFTHPLVREALYGELGLARTRQLHARVAEALESFLGAAALDHAGELAYHFARAASAEQGPKAVRYLTAAGREALGKFSNREAADYLGAALTRARLDAGTTALEPELIEDLARARQRLGDFDGAVELWRRRLDMARADDDSLAAAQALRRLGLIDYWRGDHLSALEHFAQGFDAARAGRDEELQARLHIARGQCAMELGRADEAREEMQAALRLAERSGRNELLARVHLLLLLLHTWVGPPDRAREHGARALELAEGLSATSLLCSVHWGLTVLAGLNGDSAGVSRHLAAAEQLAEQLGSPIHRVRVAEPAIEFLASTGDWKRALGVSEMAIQTARALSQRSLLCRLLVWTSLIHIGRGDLAKGRELAEEAWELSGAGDPSRTPDVHTAVPAHVARASYLLAMGDAGAAIGVAEAGLAIADRTGYTAWAIHRLLPTLAEAYLTLGDLEGATRIGARLRTDSERLGHALGLAWADACEALLVWLRGNIAEGVRRLSDAADRLEAIPAVPDAARLRRHFAARLRDHGDREGALRELRHIHEVFVRLGAERELAKTREQIRELGARPPTREQARGAEGLSEREIEIAEMAAQGRSNKAIAKSLGISPRTVSTHLSNIFAKLEISSRGELAAYLRNATLVER